MYRIAARASRGNEDYMAGYFPLVMGKAPLLWLDNLLARLFVQDLSKPSIKLLDPDNPELHQHDQTSAPPHDVLMLKKENDWHKTFIDFILN
jgi:hypothetical protein